MGNSYVGVQPGLNSNLEDNQNDVSKPTLKIKQNKTTYILWVCSDSMPFSFPASADRLLIIVQKYLRQELMMQPGWPRTLYRNQRRLIEINLPLSPKGLGNMCAPPSPYVLMQSIKRGDRKHTYEIVSEEYTNDCVKVCFLHQFPPGVIQSCCHWYTY